MSEWVVVIGATSAIGRAFTAQLCLRGHDLILAGRSQDELERVAADARIRYRRRVVVEKYDAQVEEQTTTFATRALAHTNGRLRGIVVCHGQMPDEQKVRTDLTQLEVSVRVNYTSSIALLEQLCPHLVNSSAGFICAITSVAGDRGRPSNALYGSSKGALSLYLGGLRARLSRKGVAVLTVKPGFVDTRMTWGLPGLFLVASPERVVRDALRGIDRNRAVVYTPFFWRWVMLIIRWIPDRAFGRLDL